MVSVDRVDVADWTYSNPDGHTEDVSYEILKRRYGKTEHSAFTYMRAKLRCWDRSLAHALPVRDLVDHRLILPPAAPDFFLCPDRLWAEVDQQTDWQGEPHLAAIATIWFPGVRSQAWAIRQVGAFAQAEIADRHGVAVHLVVHAPARIAHAADFHAHLVCTARTVTTQGLGTFAQELLGSRCQLRFKATWDAWWGANPQP